MAIRRLFGISICSEGRTLLALTPFFLAIGIASLHPVWMKPVTAQQEVVRLDVSVTEKAGRSITGLTREEFAIFEDGVEQKIESFNNQETPVSFGIVIDSSGSARTALRTSQEIASKLIRQMKPDDEAFILKFKVAHTLIHPFTSEQSDLIKSLDLIYTSGGTALFDAIAWSSEYASLNGRHNTSQPTISMMISYAKLKLSSLLRTGRRSMRLPGKATMAEPTNFSDKFYASYLATLALN
jgi:VWFA-related protein